MDSPVELPNGQLVCGKHGLVICGNCTVDYSFMDEFRDDDGDDDDDEYYDLAAINETKRVNRGAQDEALTIDDIPDYMLGLKKFKGTGRVFASIFTPPIAQPGSTAPSPSPEMLFKPAVNRCSSPAVRFINTNDQEQMLVYTDGACLNNGQPNPRAGWAFVFGPGMQVRRRLEYHGPFGGPAEPQTSNRAELRAVIGVLRFRHWSDPGEGFKSIVVATDSEYVVNGATKWAKGWVKKGWKTSAGGAVKNKDLWELLLGEFERWHDEGLEVMFWRIGRELNSVADTAAKKAAEEDPDVEGFGDTHGIGC